MTMPQVGNVERDSFGESVNHKLDHMVGNREHGQLVQIDRANEPLPIREVMWGVVGRTEQISVLTSATLIAAANPYRKAIKITNTTGTQLVWLGFSNAVSATTGDYLHSAAGSNTVIDVKGEIWGIAITTTQVVSIMESEYEH